MRAFASNLMSKIARHRNAPLSDLVNRAVRLAGDTTRAALFLRGCDRVGVGARCAGPVSVKNHGHIELGSEVRFNATFNAIELSTGPDGTIVMGDDVFVNYGTVISARQRVTIGNHVLIGNHSVIADTEQPGVDGEAAPIVIEDGAWLAVRVVVLPGAKIGAGAMITAGSVVAGEIPPGVVAGGIPARVRRKLKSAGESGRAANPSTDGPPLGPDGLAATRGADGALAASSPLVLRGRIATDVAVQGLAEQLARAVDHLRLQTSTTSITALSDGIGRLESGSGGDFALVWAQPESAAPSFARYAAGEAVTMETLLAEVDRYAALVQHAFAKDGVVLVPSWTARSAQHDPHGGRRGGALRALTAMNLRLMDRLESTNAYVLDAQRWGADSAEIARDVRAALLALRAGHEASASVDAPTLVAS